MGPDEASRPATQADVPRLAELCAVAVEELAPTRGGAVFAAREAPAPPVEADYRDAIDDPARGVWAGTIDEVVVGYAMTRTESLRDGTRLGVIEALFVEAPARGVGVGECLMNDVLAWCRDQACDGVDATALPGARETKNFFEGAGFSARLLVMHHRMK